MCLSAILGVGSALIGASSANKAANAQTAAANNDIAFQRETRDQIVERMDPFYQSGLTAQDAYKYNLGLGEAPQGYQGYEASPGYQWAFDQGTAGVNALAGAKGGLNSGRTMQDLNTFGQGIASQDWGNYMNRLAGLTDQGMGAAGLQAQASSNAAAGVSNAYSNIGNANAAGAIGVGNALQTGIGNIAGIYNYQNSLAKSQPLFGGNSWG